MSKSRFFSCLTPLQFEYFVLSGVEFHYLSEIFNLKHLKQESTILIARQFAAMMKNLIYIPSYYHSKRFLLKQYFIQYSIFDGIYKAADTAYFSPFSLHSKS